MKIKKILKKIFAIFIIFLAAAIVTLYFSFNAIVKNLNKRIFTFILKTLDNEVKEIEVNIRGYKFDWRNRKLYFYGIEINGHLENNDANSYIDEIILTLNYHDWKYPINFVEIKNGNLHTILHSLELVNKIKELLKAPPSAVDSYFIRNLKITNINLFGYDKFSDIKASLNNLNLLLNFEKKEIANIKIETNNLNFYVFNKGILSFLKEQKFNIAETDEHTLFEDLIFEYSVGDAKKNQAPHYKLLLHNKKTVLKIDRIEDTRLIFELLNLDLPFPQAKMKVNLFYDCLSPHFYGAGNLELDNNNFKISYQDNIFKLSDNKRDYLVYDFNQRIPAKLTIHNFQIGKYFEKINGAVSLDLDLKKIYDTPELFVKLNAKNLYYNKIHYSGNIEANINFLEKSKLKPVKLKAKSDYSNINDEKIKFEIDCTYQNYDILINKLHIAPIMPFDVYNQTISTYFDCDTGILELSPRQIKLSGHAKLTNLLEANKVFFVYNIKSDSFVFDYNYADFSFSGFGHLIDENLRFNFRTIYKNKLLANIFGQHNIINKSFAVETTERSALKFKLSYFNLQKIDFSAELNERFLDAISYPKKLLDFNSYIDINVRDKIIYKLKLLYSEKNGDKILAYVDGVNQKVNIEKLVFEIPSQKGTITLSGVFDGDIFKRTGSVNLKANLNNVNYENLKITGNMLLNAYIDLRNEEYKGTINSTNIDINNTLIDNINLIFDYKKNLLKFERSNNLGYSLAGEIENRDNTINIKDLRIFSDTLPISYIIGTYNKINNAINIKYRHLANNLANLAIYSDFIRKIEGTGKFELEITNKITEPIINAELAFNNVNLYLMQYVRELRNLNGSIKIKNNNVFFENVQMNNHRGSIILTSDTGSNLNNLNLNVIASKIKVEVPEVEMVGEADINGKLVGTLKKPVFKGSAYVSNAQFTYPPLKPQPDSKYDSNAVYPYWDANVHIRENVWYRYPMINVELDKGNTIHFLGDKYHLRVKGYLSSRSGNITYLSQRFNLNFVEMNVNSEAGVPIVNGEASAVIDGLEIKLLYSGPVDKFKPTFRAPARPELTEEDVHKIVRTGTTGNLTQLQRVINIEEDYSAAKFVDKNVSSFLLRPLEQKLMDEFNLYINVNAPVFENILRREKTSDTDALYNNLLLNTTFSIGKYFAKNLYLEYRGQLVNMPDENPGSSSQGLTSYRTGLKSELEAKYRFDKETFLRYKWSPAIERDKDAEHFIMLEKRIKFR